MQRERQLYINSHRNLLTYLIFAGRRHSGKEEEEWKKETE